MFITVSFIRLEIIRQVVTLTHNKLWILASQAVTNSESIVMYFKLYQIWSQQHYYNMMSVRQCNYVYVIMLK